MIFLFRLSHWLHRHHVPVLPRLLYALTRVVFSIALPPGAQVGQDVWFGYSDLGIVVHSRAVIGDQAKFSQIVTIDGRTLLFEVRVLEDDKKVGALACLLEPIRTGRVAKIGSKTVVLIDLSACARAVGIIAKLLPLRSAQVAGAWRAAA